MQAATPQEQANALVTLAVIGSRSSEAETDKSCMTECYSCTHCRSVAGNAHVLCAKPDAGMTGNRHGIERGWFMYPLLFDPVWKTKQCCNFEVDDAVSHAVSHPVSRVS